ncbi:MAG TPA: 2-oxoglutarate dehydrogenase E1 component, partial [Nitrolancea sp.]|nr:2-oxoglutarate dehydrogenase E1 component [Nitrolancea sp.]
VTVPMLDEIIREAADNGTGEVIIGMAHRGRLNVMAHVLGKPYAQIIGEFMGIHHREPTSASDAGSSGWTGDVKYHLGAYRPSGGELRARITLAANPSHLEFVNPVIEGMTRAAQDDRTQRGAPRQNVDACLPINLHGDSALPGEGVAAETLNLSRLAGYQTGGTVHLITNNQIGYTTEPDQSRSTAYASDLARGFEIPVVHVNGDDPEACLAAAKMAYAYRQRFHKDFLVDVVGYRRWGHNEGDEPAFTQPLMYAIISKRPTVRAVWAERLEQEGVIQPGQADQLLKQQMDQLQQIRGEIAASKGHREEPPTPMRTTAHVRPAETAVPRELLEKLNQEIHALPEGFTLNPKLQRNMSQRAAAVAKGGPIDWAHAEDLALASILYDSTPVRMTGQDVERGTFSQRHLIFHDINTGKLNVPLQTMPDAHASFAIYNSPLSEAAPLGFEYGYSVHAPEAMVVWEAQFGDFANAGQVIVDQFIAAGRAKWDQISSLVLLLPHGYEGQGPEHSSARLERYLQLCANDNLRVANCTTSAQYFHLLRKQAALLNRAPRPLILMTPKVLLRHPLAASPVEEFTSGQFQPVLDDPNIQDRQTVTRVVACSGKVYVDLAGSKERAETRDVAVIRLELLYPFPEENLRALLSSYPNARQLIWLQEEPRNMGAWTFVHPWLEAAAGDQLEVVYVGRPERASPAEGWAELHRSEQDRIVHEALTGAPVMRESYGVKHGD